MTIDNILTEEENKYFETGGNHELGEDVERGTGEQGEPVSSSGHHEGDGADAQGEGGDNDHNDDGESEGPGAESGKPKRDFKKAYDSERLKRSELKKQLQEQSYKTEQMEQALREMAQKLNGIPTAKDNEEELPNPEEDPLGYTKYQLEKLNQTVKQQQEYLQSQSQKQEAANKYQQFVNSYANSAKEYANEVPDFSDAYQYLNQQRLNEHIEAGYTPEQAQSILLEEEMALVSKAYQDGVNPAERVYKLAKYRGYRGTPKPAGPKKLDTVQKGVQNSKSLGTSGAMNSSSGLSLDSIDSMDFNEFDKLWSDIKSGKANIG